MAQQRTLIRTLIAAGAGLAVVAAGVAGPASAASSTATAMSPVSHPASLVNPFIGTSGGVNTYPGPDVPFGMMQWSPDTSPDRNPGGGYEYADSNISGFSLTHISGPGCGGFGDIPILPTVGALPSNPSSATEPFSHAAESASAGYYSVQLGSTAPVLSELTETQRSGLGRFTFPATTQANMLFKLSGSQNGTSATSARIIGNNEVEGSATSGGFCGASDTYTVYFDVTFDHPFTTYGTWTGATVTPGARTQSTKAGTATRPAPSTPSTPSKVPAVHGFGDNAPKTSITPKQPAATTHTTQTTPAASTSPDGVYVTFDTTAHQVLQAKVGISFVSAAGAALNAHVEQPTWNFSAVHSAAVTSWNNLLGRIQIGGGTPARQQVFYTALYHALLQPNVFDDVNGQYIGFDNQVHTSPAGHDQYANYSGWDTYRSQVQLSALIAPHQTSDTIQSMVNDADQNHGQLPKWALANGESYVMVGDPADGLMSGAYAFGARDFDTQSALSYALAEATKPNNIRPGLNYYESLGYLPADGTYGCCNYYGDVSTNLEYGSADFALSQFAAALGDSTDAQMLLKRSQNWQNLFNPATGLIQPKTISGKFVPVSPVSSSDYVEGDASQYRWVVPYNKQGLFAAMGGPSVVNPTLDTFYTDLNDGPGSPYAYWDNQFGYETPWSYDFTGAPYKAQALVDRIRTQLYLDTPASEGDNDDLGATASMGVDTMLGMFPIYIGTADLVLNSPEFPLEIIHLANGNKITISASGAGLGSVYIQSMKIDGQASTKPWLPASYLTSGAQIDVALGTTPNTTWGAAPTDAPPSYTQGELPALGYATPGSQIIVGPGATTSATVAIRNITTSPQTVSWTATADNGLTVTPSQGTLTAAPNADATTPVTLTAGTTEGRYGVVIHYTMADGTTLPTSGLQTAVAKPGEIWPYYDNAGVSADGATTNSSYDGDGFLYSANQLAAKGLTPGATITSDGVSYTWPNTASGDPDNIQAGGQTIPISLPAGSTKIGLLGSATNSDSKGATGTLTVTYTDGTSQQIPVGISDWTLGASSFNPLPADTTIAATPYRNTGNGGMQTITTYLFATDGTLQAGKTVASVTLPITTDGTFHVFAIGAG